MAKPAKPKKQSVKKIETNAVQVVSAKIRSDRFIFDEGVIKTIETLAGYGLTQKQICDYLGISPDLMRLRNEENPEILSAMWRGKAKGLATVSQMAFTMASNGKNSDMTKFYLKAKGGWVETEKKMIVGGDEDDQPVKVQAVDPLRELMKDPEIAKAIKLIAQKTEKK